MGKKYRCMPFKRFPMEAGHELVYFVGCGHVCTVSQPIANELSAWAAFVPLDDQVATTVRRLPFVDAAKVYELFTELEKQGCLIELSEMVGVCATRGASTREGSISWLGIPTCGRGRELERLIVSYARNARRFGRKYKILVSEDEHGGLTMRSTREALAVLSCSTGMEIYYAGREEKVRFARQLAKGTGIREVIAELCLFGFHDAFRTAGANRNAVLLQTLDALVMSVDDDTVCLPGAVPGSDRETLRFTAHSLPWETWCFSDMDSAIRFAEPAEIDLLSEHEVLLGQSLNSLMAVQAESKLNVDGLCSHMINSSKAGTGLVKLTFNGIVGDSGLHSDFGIITNSDSGTRSRVRMLGLKYDEMVRSRKVASQPLTRAVSHGLSSGLGAAFAFDNRATLPPFMPGFDNEDGFFARLLGRLDDEAYIGHVPYTVVHQPPGERCYAPNRDYQIRMGDIVAGCLAAWKPTLEQVSMAARLQSLGGYLQGIGRSALGEFRDLLYAVACRKASAMVEQCERVLTADGHRPPYWVSDLQSRMQAIRKNVTTAGMLLPSDLAFEEEQQTLRRTQQIVAQVGELLFAWPEIITRSRKLRDAGVELARKV
jgi:hypothetical protein